MHFVIINGNRMYAQDITPWKKILPEVTPWVG